MMGSAIGSAIRNPQSAMFQAVRDDRLEDAARRHQRSREVPFVERAPAVDECRLEHWTQPRIMHELEATRRGRRRGRGCFDLAQLEERGARLLENVEDPADDLAYVRLDDGAAAGRSDEQRAAEGARQPVRLAAARQLMDRRRAGLLPGM